MVLKNQFLWKNTNPIKSKNSFYKLQKHVNNIQVTPFQKKLILISKNKIKGKSKCAICLTQRTFIHEIEDKYGLESELEIYLQFFTD